MTVTGSMYHQAFPHFFEFELTSPAKDYFCASANHCWYKSNSTLEKDDESLEVINQTCADIKNWFKTDLGFGEDGYFVDERKFSSGILIQHWKTDDKSKPVRSMKTFSDARGRFLQLEIFLEDDVLMARTFLSDYVYKKGRVFPTKIRTESYSQGSRTQITTIEFLSVDFAKIENKIPEAVISQSGSPLVELKNMSAREKGVQGKDRANGKKGFSLLGLGVDAGYWFYKKFITSQDMSHCSYDPSCSNYMVLCIKRDGLLGLIEGLDRLERCTTHEDRVNLYTKTPKEKFLDTPNLLNERKNDNFKSQMLRNNEQAESILPDLDENQKTNPSLDFAHNLFLNGYIAEALPIYEAYVKESGHKENFDKSAAGALVKIYANGAQPSTDIYALAGQTLSVQKQDKFCKEIADSYKSLRTKSRTGATVLSMLLPGMGHVYLSNYRRGIFTFIEVVSMATAVYYCQDFYGQKNWRPWLFGAIGAVDWITDIYGANKAAQRYNQRLYREADGKLQEKYLEVLYED
ncbi:MAG: membrane protein insertion efficiency factor YidD [Treponema sp.]|nr:membrane protein insertion efficiency factor YidD [Treponema sp.]